VKSKLNDNRPNGLPPRPNHLFALVAILAIVLFLLYVHERGKNMAQERFFNYCHSYCVDVKDCSSELDPQVEECKVRWRSGM
jgi:hypothetical protein